MSALLWLAVLVFGAALLRRALIIKACRDYGHVWDHVDEGVHCRRCDLFIREGES